ncbi:unnamed protein product [Polarella glacialis]|uniref:Thioredoxin domain-containing protein n=1 Tax=Polarella glacialis TaxID=89957 RepID=A0A813DVQ0_POLGL|nr:unnamed protein product [Polarella glacialis]CAE8734028.1 unnamed protein product [Polarella glacialis]
MSAPFTGRRVAVQGTSREDLNGSHGLAVDFDRDKGRYNVRLDKCGQIFNLKPANLLLLDGGEGQGGASSSSAAAKGGTSEPVSSWTKLALVGMAAAWLFQFYGQFTGEGAEGWAGGDEEYDDRDEGYLSGHVREVRTLAQLRGALAQHSDNTGLPVIVDFYSHSCGPCRMIAPVFKSLAAEMKGKAVFLKVDASKNYEASNAFQVSGLPTIQFFLHRKKLNQVRGADERGLRSYTEEAVRRAEEAGVFTGKEVTSEALQKFYEVNDPSKAGEAIELAEKYAEKTALLIRICNQKYSLHPDASLRRLASKEEGSGKRNANQTAAAKDASSMSTEYLRIELQRIQAELQKRGEAESSEEVAEDETRFLPAAEVATEEIHRLVIVGGGPAALSAAVYAARAGLKPLVLAPAFGGQLLGKGVDVENYPGVVGAGATGRGLVLLMRSQAQSFESRFVDAAVVGVDFSTRPFRLRLNGTETALQASSVILASGAESRWLHVEGEQAFRGQGVSACATCDGFLMRGKDVVVVGGGDHAMEDALYLARICRSVTIVHRRDHFRASKFLADRALGHSSIKVKWNSTVKAFHGHEGKLSHVTVQSAGQEERLEADGAFVAVGHDPQTAFLAGQVELDAAGYVVLRKGTATSVRGVFAAGDVADHTYRQAITASGTGAMSALDVERFLNEED